LPRVNIRLWLHGVIMKLTVPNLLFRRRSTHSAYLNGLLALSFLCCMPVAGAEDLPRQIQDQYKDKVMMLRNSYCGPELQFDSQGSPTPVHAIGPWTECRNVRIESLSIKKDRLKLSGRRVLLYYDYKQKRFADVTEVMPNKGKKEYRDFVDSLKVSIEVQLPPGELGSAVQSAVDKIFYPSEQDFIETASALWKPFLLGETDKPRAAGQPLVGEVSSDKVVRLGKGIAAPKAIYAPDPDFTDSARRVKYQGTNVFNVVVDKNGRVANVLVTRPLGMGLDESAAARILTWKFNPALKDGQPVAVEVNVEVSFNLY